MTEVELAAMHLKGLTSALGEVQTQMAALRRELYLALKRAEDAETSRDTIRNHAQAALLKYRAQPDALELLRDFLEPYTRSTNNTETGRKTRAFLEKLDADVATAMKPVDCTCPKAQPSGKPLVGAGGIPCPVAAHRPEILSDPGPSGGSPQGA